MLAANARRGSIPKSSRCMIRQSRKIVPYEYDMEAEWGWVSVTRYGYSAFAVESIRPVVAEHDGRGRIPMARQLLIQADQRASNGYASAAVET